jgi:hypothetical protein
MAPRDRAAEDRCGDEVRDKVLDKVYAMGDGGSLGGLAVTPMQPLILFGFVDVASVTGNVTNRRDPLRMEDWRGYGTTTDGHR